MSLRDGLVPPPPQAPGEHERIMAEAERITALGETEPRLARDEVSQPIINAWLDAIDEADPRWTAGEAPPAMAQVWTMPGLRGTRGAADPLSQAMQVLDDAGFTSVLGTNCAQTYERYLRVGEQVSVTTRLESIVGPKRTGVGEGYFVTTRNVWRVGEDEVASMLFRVLKFAPRPRVPEEGEERARLEGVDRSKVIRPVRNIDTDFFWEGTQVGELRLQTCNACGELRHPPGPVCPSCHAMDRGHVVSTGRGTIFSFLVHHAPQMPGRELPLTIALVELEESRHAGSPVRMVADVRGNPEDLAIGDPVVVGWDRVDDELTLPIWVLRDASSLGSSGTAP